MLIDFKIIIIVFFEIIIIQPLIVIVLVGREDFYYVFQVFAFLGTTLSRIFRNITRLSWN